MFYAHQVYPNLFNDYPNLRKEKDTPLPTSYQEFIFKTHYARFIPEEERRETWQETVFRYLDFINYQSTLFGYKIHNLEMYALYQGIIGLEVMPSMRLMWSAGEAVKKDAAAAYNCCYTPVDRVEIFDEILYLLMCGCGVGFSVEEENISQLPGIPMLNQPGRIIYVEDSKVGWATATRSLMNLLYSGIEPTWDLNAIRPEGSRLKVFGGYASGPRPLDDLFSFIVKTFRQAEGRKLNSLEVHDIVCMIGSAVVSGGVRRSALISLSDLDDSKMRNAKNGDWFKESPHRSLSNNSAVYHKGTSSEDFWAEWNNLINSGSGERGIFGRGAAIDKAKSLGRRDPNYSYGCNPCLSGDTSVLTKQGHFPIKDLVGKTVNIWNGATWQEIDNFRVTGEDQPMLKLTLHDNSEIRMTPYHTMILEDDTRIEAGDLEPGMVLKRISIPEVHGTIHELGAYAKGFSVAEGTKNTSGPILWIYGPKRVCLKRLMSSLEELPKQDIKATFIKKDLGVRSAGENILSVQGLTPLRDAILPWVTNNRKELPPEIYNWDLHSKCEFIAGAFDGDGTASDTKNGFMYQISSIHKKWLQDFQLLLKTVGVASHLSLMRKAGFKDFNDGYGEYESKECWRITISQFSSIILAQQVQFSRLVSFVGKETTYKLKSRWPIVKSIEEDGVDEKVYCCTVDGPHSFALSNHLLVGQCSEIYLRPRQMCNLSEVVVRPWDTNQSLKLKVELATILGTIQSTITNFRYISKDWQNNCQEERLLGVSLTGVADNQILFSDDAISSAILQGLKKEAIRTNKVWAKKLSIPQSAAITAVKPSGTVSQLVDSASGLHARYSPYYIRRVRLNKSDPVAQHMVKAGIPCEDDITKPDNTWVFSFPMMSPENSVFTKDLSALTHAKIWKNYQDSYCEHKPSVTLHIHDGEWVEIGTWLFDNLESVSGMAFLPYSNHGYEQAPFEEIRMVDFVAMELTMPEIDWDSLRETQMPSQAGPAACESGACLLGT